jgi:DNA-binding PadR family transcriptional regulator
MMWHAGPPFSPWRFKERMFEKGDLKYVILGLLADKPRHGYEVIRDLEERFGGFYSPSPGAVYPTLQLLEDMGYVTSDKQDGKRIFEITEEGRQFLSDRKDTIDEIASRMKSRFGPWFNEEGAKEVAEEMKAFALDMKDFARTFARSQGGAWGDPSKREKVREILKRTREEIDGIFNEPK